MSPELVGTAIGTLFAVLVLGVGGFFVRGLMESARRAEQAVEAERARLHEREQGLERRAEALDAREGTVADKLRQAEEKFREAEATLRRVAELTPEEATARILESVEQEARALAEARARAIEAEAVTEAERHARKLLIETMQRQAVDTVTEATIAVVELPSEDMKGRLIGRDGRNIRAFEQTTGVDLIIDETPEAVVLSCFDPVRREVARLTLINLMMDGRIHPARIEELFGKASKEVDRTVKQAGQRAMEAAGVTGLHARVVETLGRLRFRTSYAQNVLDHSVETSRICATLAAELGLNVEVAKRAGLLHDIGKALGPEVEGPHALTGMEFLRTSGEKEPILNAVGAHHHEIPPASAEAEIVILADVLSATRPGARRENLDQYLKRLTALESLANGYPGVARSYAVQAGREIRLIVKPETIDDRAAAKLAKDVAAKIHASPDFPGQVKVTVIRETRFTQTSG